MSKPQDKLREKQKREQQQMIGDIRKSLLTSLGDFSSKHASKFFTLLSILGTIFIIYAFILFSIYLYQSNKEEQMDILWKCISYVIAFFFGNIMHSKK